MRELRLLLNFIIITVLIAGNLFAQQSAVIKIDPDRIIGSIDPNIYGSFLEPLGRGVVYGALYDPSSPFADENGFRKDFMQQIKELKVPVIRWPGGNFVSGYNWEDGIGLKAQRPASFDLSRSRTYKIAEFNVFIRSHLITFGATSGKIKRGRTLSLWSDSIFPVVA